MREPYCSYHIYLVVRRWVGVKVVGGQVWHGLVRRTGAGAALRPAAWRRCPPPGEDGLSLRQIRARHSRTSLDNLRCFTSEFSVV